MAYIAPIHRPSSVRHAIKLHFLDPEEDCLVVAKANRLEFYTQSSEDDSLVLRHSRLLHGKITMLQKLKPSISTTEHLFVGTARYQYFTLSWDATTKQLKTEYACHDLSDSTAREVQTEQRCLIDPGGEFMTLEVYEGIITAFPLIQRGKRKTEVLATGVLGEPVSARIPEFIVRSSAFLPRPPGRNEKPKHALLFEDYEGKVRLRIRELNYTAGTDASVEFEDDPQRLPMLPMDLGANILIPVQGAPYGLLILSETEISYFNEENFTKITRPLDEATSFKAWEQIDNQRYILSDIYGKLYLLMLLLDFEEKVQEWRLDVLGEISVASALVYLDAGCIFVGSHQGDSKVVRIVEGKDGSGSLESVQTFSNIAPILDFTIMDMGSRSGEGQTNEYSSGQARLVTGSGAFADGSLRSVRSGVGMQDLGIISEMKDVTQIFSLRTDAGAENDDTLLVSFINESRVFYFSPDGDIEELSNHKGLLLDSQTLLAANLSNGRILQATPSSINLLDLDSGMSTSQWSPPSGTITAVSSTDTHVLVSIDGTTLTVLTTGDDLAVQCTKQFPPTNQISCITISSSIPTAAIIGNWHTPSISTLSLTDLSIVATTKLSDDPISIPRNLLIAQLFEPPYPPTLLVATADGNVTTFDVDTSTHELSSKKSTILGTREASFRALPRGSNGLSSVFATCEHSSLVYSSENRLVFSAVEASNAVSVASFDGAAYPGAIAIATSDDLRVAIIDTERTTHIQTLTVGETVRRIAYSPALKAFGLGTIKLTLRDGVETLTSHFQLADEVLFKTLDTYKLNADEIVETVIRAPLEDGLGDTAERFIVGTSIVTDEEDAEYHGRIIVFEVTEDRILKQLAEQSVRGACRRLAVLESGHIVAALIKTIVVFKFRYQTASTPVFDKCATYRTATAPIDLTISPTSPNQIVVADLMKSISVLEFKQQSKAAAGNDELIEIARHYQTLWTTAVAELAEDTWVVADSEENLLVLARDKEGATEDDRRRLRVTSEISLGEMVNRIRMVDVKVGPNAVVVPKAFLATVEGSIHLLSLIQPAYQNLLIQLQDNLASLLVSPGGLPFLQYRGFKNQVREAEEPLRFVDGELVEKFLDATPEVQQKAVEGLEAGVEDVRELVEGLRRLC